MKPHYRGCNIPGTPFKIGDSVKILPNQNRDETFDDRLMNETGEVLYFEYNCGCGQTFPGDPMVGVKLTIGRIEEFWKEELELSANLAIGSSPSKFD